MVLTRPCPSWSWPATADTETAATLLAAHRVGAARPVVDIGALVAAALGDALVSTGPDAREWQRCVVTFGEVGEAMALAPRGARVPAAPRLADHDRATRRLVLPGCLQPAVRAAISAADAYLRCTTGDETGARAAMAEAIGAAESLRARPGFAVVHLQHVQFSLNLARIEARFGDAAEAAADIGRIAARPPHPDVPADWWAAAVGHAAGELSLVLFDAEPAARAALLQAAVDAAAGAGPTHAAAGAAPERWWTAWLGLLGEVRGRGGRRPEVVGADVALLAELLAEGPASAELAWHVTTELLANRLAAGITRERAVAELLRSGSGPLPHPLARRLAVATPECVR